MNHKRRIHDAIVGVVVTAGGALGYYVNPLWLLVPGVIGVTLIVRDRYGTLSPLPRHPEPISIASQQGYRQFGQDQLKAKQVFSLNAMLHSNPSTK